MKKSGGKKGGWSLAQLILIVVGVIVLLWGISLIYPLESKSQAAGSWIWDGIMELLRKAIGA